MSPVNPDAERPRLTGSQQQFAPQSLRFRGGMTDDAEHNDVQLTCPVIGPAEFPVTRGFSDVENTPLWPPPMLCDWSGLATHECPSNSGD